MMPIPELLKLLLIVVVIGLPPYLIALKIFKRLNPIILSLLSLVYWIGTFYTQQVAPFLLIVIILVEEYILSKKDTNIFAHKGYDEKFHLKDFFLILFFTLVIRFPLGVINYFFIIILDLLGIGIQQQEMVDIFVNSQEPLLNIFLLTLIVLMAPINEEFSMRYWLFDKVLSPKVGIILAAILSSTLFTILHYNIVGIPTFFGLGLFACYVYYKKGFWGAVTVHFTFNLSSAVMLMAVKNLMV